MKRSRNTYRVHPDGYMIGTDFKGEEFCFDLSDYEMVKKYTWVNHKGYIVTNILHFYTSMHRLITNCPRDKAVDHANHDTVDNRKKNLRVCTTQQNSSNVIKNKTNMTSKYKGVYWSKRQRRWYTKIKVKGKTINIGGFEIEEDASRAYNDKALFYFGEFAYLNIPVEVTQ